MISKSRFSVVTAALLAAMRLEARPMRMPGGENLVQLVKDADLTVRGIVTHISGRAGAFSPDGLTIEVEKVYKGSAKDKLDVAIQSSSSLCPIPREGNGVLILATVKDGKATVADCSTGIWSAAKVVETTEAKSSLEDDILADLKDADHNIIAGALRQLAGLGTRRGHEALKQFLVSDDPDIRAAAVRGLLTLGDTSALSAVASLEDKKFNDWFVLGQIHGAISTIKDKAAVPDLIQLTRSSHDDLVKSAAYALREIKSPSSVSRLVELLDHPSRDVRFDALAGLDAIVHGKDSEMPSPEAFEKNPDKFVAHWKDWWMKTGKKRYEK